MNYILRAITALVEEALARDKSVLILGPRQVGKTTMVTNLNPDKSISLARPAIRQQYEKDIESFSQEIEALDKKDLPLVYVDEVQKIPELMDAIQDLIDRKVAKFILTGSSARKLRYGKHINWLPGRIISLNMNPLQLLELTNFNLNINDLLIYGSLPEILLEKNEKYKEQNLESYVVNYLEEEIRQEALVRNIGSFAKFLQLAAAESGNLLNFNKLSQEIDVAQTTISSYYQILEDCLIIKRIEPIQKSKVRRKLSKTPKYLFFDLGLRRIAANEGNKLTDKTMGHLFEQFVGLEILRILDILAPRAQLMHWRDLDGKEVDWVICHNNKMLPIEVKWSSNPTEKHAKNLNSYLEEYDEAKKSYIICRVENNRKITNNILATSWKSIPEIINSFINSRE